MCDSCSPSPFVKNRTRLSQGAAACLRGHALDILEAGLARGIPELGTRALVSREGHVLTIDGQNYDLKAYDRVVVLGVGKASFPIAEALEDILGHYLSGGLLVVKKGEKRQLSRIRVMEGAHPIPDASSVEAGHELLALARSCGAKDLVLAPVTGGATALATIPHPGLTLADIETMNDIVLKSGANIREMNIVRRHLCRVKGGRLVTAAQPAMVVTLTLDTALPGMPWPDMCLPDADTFLDAIAILKRFHVWEKTPTSVQNFLLSSHGREDLETVKNFEGVNARMVMVGDPYSMCQAAAHKAAQLGYTPLILASRMHGEARETGVCLAGIANEILAHNGPVPVPCALICSGECTVTIADKAGKGGPNQEFVLSVANQVDAGHGWVCASIDTDGTDGPSDLAGGIVDSTTAERVAHLGLSLPDVLQAHDSGTVLCALGDEIITGHTGTNLQHLRLLLLEKP